MSGNKEVNTEKEIKVMIAEDHVVMRREICDSILKNSKTIDIIGAAENGKVLLEMVKENLPDIVVLDIHMPVMNGVEVLKVFKKDYPSIKTIIYSSDYSEFIVADAVLNGAAAYIDKLNGDIPDIITAIEKVFEQGYYFDQIAAQEIIQTLNKQKKIYFLIENQKFSEKDIEIIRQI